MFVRKKVAIMATNLTDGHTIPCTQDVGASPTKEPSYHLGGQEMESHLCRKDNSKVNPLHVIFILRPNKKNALIFVLFKTRNGQPSIR